MKVKILVNSIPRNIDHIFYRASKFFQKNGVNFEYDIQKISVMGYRSKKVVVPTGGFRNIIESSGTATLPYLSDSYDATIFVFNGDNFGRDKMPTSNTCITSVGRFPMSFVNLLWYEDETEQELFLSLIHEMMHCMKDIVIVKTATVLDDCMDIMVRNGKVLLYYKNDQPDAPDSNFQEMFRILTPYFPILNKDTTMKVTLKRDIDNGIETLGTLTILKEDGSSWNCQTLELPWKNNDKNISCIPKGKYVCSADKIHNGRKTYQLKAVKDRDGILIHPANYVHDLKGCISLGAIRADIDKDGQFDVTSSQRTVQEFMDILENKDFFLEII